MVIWRRWVSRGSPAVKRDADIAEAEAIRDSRIQKARAEEEGQKAELLRDTNIAEASKEKELKIASFKKDQDLARAEADQAYAIQEATLEAKRCRRTDESRARPEGDGRSIWRAKKFCGARSSMMPK